MSKDNYFESTLFESFFETPGAMRLILRVEDEDYFYIKVNNLLAENYGKPKSEIENHYASEIGIPNELIKLWVSLAKKSKDDKNNTYSWEHYRDFGKNRIYLKYSASVLENNIYALEVRDKTSEKKTQELLKLENDLAISLSSANSFEKVLELCLNAIIEVSGMDCGGIYLLDEQTRKLNLKYHKNLSIEFIREVREYDIDSENYKMVMQGDNIFLDKTILDKFSAGKTGNLSSVAVIPFTSNNKIFGCVNIGSFSKHFIDSDTLLLIDPITSFAGGYIAKAITEENLRIKTEELDKFFQYNVDLLCIADVQGNFIRLNPQWETTLGFTNEELMKKKFFELIHTEDLENTYEAVKRLNEQRDVINFVNRYRCKNEGYKWIEWRATPIGKIIYAAARDITERIEYEKKLAEQKFKAEDASRIKSNFLANMSHELRTPLVGILGFAELLENELTDNEYKIMAKRINESGVRLLETLNLILDLSRVEAGKLPVEMKRFDLIKSVKDSVYLFEKVAKAKNIELKFSTTEKELFILLDERLVGQIIHNLVNNALKFTKIGSVTVTIGKRRDEDSEYVLIKVIDTGIGISEEKIDVIFKEFRQASEGLGRRFEGTGLGLTITQKFLTLLGGKISVTSKIGEGSEFSVYLPYVDMENHDITKNDIMSKHSTIIDLSDKHILLVENEDVGIEILLMFLGKSANVEVVKNGNDAIGITDFKKFDLILLDINLGKGISGLDVLKHIRSNEVNKNTIVIAVTAFAMLNDKDEFLNAGCNGYLSKPYKKSELLEIISKHLKY